jgi:hypothetical protein
MSELGVDTFNSRNFTGSQITVESRRIFNPVSLVSFVSQVEIVKYLSTSFEQGMLFGTIFTHDFFFSRFL